MLPLLTGDAFSRLFTTFAHTARRLETRHAYRMPDEDVDFQRFLNGGPDDPDEPIKRAGWLDNVRACVTAGKRFERVRIVTELPTDYQRFALRGTRYNDEAGEDVRYLDRDQAVALDLPDHDFWLFDSSRLALLYFTDDDRLLGAQIVTERDVVDQHVAWLDVAMQHATAYRRYLETDPSRQDPSGGSA